MTEPSAPAARSGRPITIIVPLPPSYRGGTEEYAYQLAREFSRSRPVRVVTTTMRWNHGIDALTLGGASLDMIAAWELFERPVVHGRPAWATLRRAVEGASIVQLHMPFPMVEKRVARWARAAGIPVVLTYHMDAVIGEDAHRPLPRILIGAYRRWSAVPAIRDADVVVSNSGGYARASPVLSRFLPKVRVMRKGVDLNRLRPVGGAEPTSIPPRRPGIPRVVFVGRIVAYKGLPDLVAAAALLKKEGRPFEILLGGKGPQEAELRAQTTALGLDPEVRFLGFVPDDQIGPLYRGADVVVCPSINLQESTPTTLQEAMAVGTPVVGTTLPGTDETVPNDGSRGRLVAVHDIPALAAAIGELIDHGRPADPVPTRDWADAAKDYLALFDSLTSAPMPVGAKP